MKEIIAEFYGKTIQKTEDLAFSACCILDYDPKLLTALTDEVKDKTAERVCKNTADMITQSRYAEHFSVSPAMFHMGLFDCSPSATSGGTDTSNPAPTTGCC